MSSRTYPDLFARIVAHVTVPDDQLEGTGCWLHDAPLSRPNVGYPRISLRLPGGKHVKRLVHVLVGEIFHGPLPPDHEWHHTCYNHRCCNPDHVVPLHRKINRSLNVKPLVPAIL